MAKKSTSMIFDIFVGNYVHIFIKGVKGNSSHGKTANLVFAGYLLDEDKDYFFLGQNAESVFAAIRKEDAVSIVLGDEGADLMEHIEIPGDQEVQ